MRHLLRALFCLLMAGAWVRATENPGVTAAQILEIPLGARAVGMGAAYTAVASDVSALYYNPGGLSRLESREFSTMYTKGIVDQSVEHVAFATPLPFFTGLLGQGYPALGASLLFAQNGSIEVNRTNPDGSFLDSRNLNAGGDFVATLGYSERVGKFAFDTKQGSYSVNHFLGVSGKFIRSTLAETYSATAYAADVGYLADCPEAGLGFGVSALNVGSKMRFIEEGDPLPVKVRSGVSYFLPLDILAIPADQALTLATDGDYLLHERQWHMNLGLEYSVLRMYAVRMGYQFNRDLAGLTIGFGVKWRGFQVDYAWAMTDALSDTHRFSFTYRFGRVPLAQREKERKPFIESLPGKEETQGLKGIEQQTPQSVDEPRRPRREAPEGQGVAPGWIY